MGRDHPSSLTDPDPGDTSISTLTTEPLRLADNAAQQENPNGAVCSTHERPDAFTDPANVRDFKTAQRACLAICPRVAACLAEARAMGDAYGVWGGRFFVDGRERDHWYTPRDVSAEDLVEPRAA